MKPRQHPATTRLFQAAVTHFLKLRWEHRLAADRMWAGTLASQFTKSELALLGAYLSPHDRALLQGVKRGNS